MLPALPQNLRFSAKMCEKGAPFGQIPVRFADFRRSGRKNVKSWRFLRPPLGAPVFLLGNWSQTAFRGRRQEPLSSPYQCGLAFSSQRYKPAGLTFRPDTSAVWPFSQPLPVREKAFKMDLPGQTAVEKPSNFGKKCRFCCSGRKAVKIWKMRRFCSPPLHGRIILIDFCLNLRF